MSARLKRQCLVEPRATIRAVLLLASAAACGRLNAIEHDKPVGEPYRLMGNRLVFSTWAFVRPGQIDWLDADGKSVYTARDRKYGPGDAHFRIYDGPRGVRITARPAQPFGPVITADQPWEGAGVSVATLLQEEGKYRLWASCEDTDGRSRACYLESADARSWTRPDLGLVEFGKDRHNNLVAPTIGTVFKDPRAAAQERYKSVWHGDFDPKRFEEYKRRRPWSVMATETDPGRVHSIRAAASPDGIHWQELPDSISVEPSDTQIVAYFDEQLQKYVMYTRNYMIAARAPGIPNPPARRHQFVGRRAIGRSESPNFREFPLSDVIIEPGADMSPTDTYYTNCRTAIPGAPDHHLLFPAVYHQDRDTTSIEVHASDDGRVWHRLQGSPVLGTSTFGEWDGGCVFASPNLVELPNGDWALPYTGYVYPHKYPRGAWKFAVGMAVWPKGRLIALEASEEGEFSTIAVTAPGTRLRINAVTQRAGSILIEAADLDGKPISGRSFEEAVPIVGDHFWTPVTWKDGKDLGIKKGDPIEFRFRLKMARVYGLQFE